jgi:putative ABC transport system permease protein
MRVVRLAFRESRFNWRRNAIFGLILLLGIGVQLFTAIADSASQAAVERYGAAVFGYPNTYTAALDAPLSVEQLRAFNGRLDDIGRSYPWFQPATSVNLGGRIRVSPADNPAAAPQLSLRAVSPLWRLMTPALADDDVWRTVTSDQRRGAAILLASATAERLKITGPAAVTLLLSAESTGSPNGKPIPATTQPGGPTDAAGDQRGPAAQLAILDVPVFGTYTELNKAFEADGIVNQNLLGLAHAGPQPVQVYWRCSPARCSDAYALISTATQVVRGKLGDATRVDTTGQLLPVLRQQRQDGQRFAAIVLALSMIAVTVVALAFVEVRAPQFATLRALGASRAAVGGIALLENCFTAAFVGLLAAFLALAAGYLDPNAFNRIPQVHLDRLDVPVAVFARTVALTLIIGLMTGLAPALAAFRSVRTS